MISRITDSPVFRRCVSIQVMLAALITVASISPAAAEDLFWMESINSCTQNLIRRTTVGSGVINDIKSSTMSYERLEIDTAAGHLYWTQLSAGPDLLLRSNLDGSGEVQIASIAEPLDMVGFTVDRSAGKVYWMEGSGCSPCGGMLCQACPRIRRANLDGNGVETLFTFPNGTTANHSDIAVDSAAGKMYWSDRQFAPHLQRSNLDGSNVQTLTTLVAPFTGVSEIALDVVGGRIYWIETAGGVPGQSRIVRANLDGTNLQQLVLYPVQEARPRGLALDIPCGKLYWTLSGFCPGEPNGRIIRANLDGTQVEDRTTGRLIMLNVGVTGGSSCPTSNSPPCGTCGAGAGLMTSLALLGMTAMRRVRRRTRH